jgi:osmoprotectant transport system ATP-binding protein
LPIAIGCMYYVRRVTAAVNELVEFRHVTKRFGSDTALCDIDLGIEAETITVLLGPSGCGKSTALRLIVALERPDEGELFFNGQPITVETVGAIRRRVGYVIQEGGLFPHLTARANLALQSRFYGRTKEETEKRIYELCAVTRFPETALDRYPLELSGGQRQRVSLMRALMLAPELLLLDEPFGALDPLVRASLQRDLKEICTRLRQTLLLVTHDLAEAARLGSKIVLMNAGRIVQQGSIAELEKNPVNEFVSEFLNAQTASLN